MEKLRTLAFLRSLPNLSLSSGAGGSSPVEWSHSRSASPFSTASATYGYIPIAVRE